jgi:tRNA-dihydrouridine synthase 1
MTQVSASDLAFRLLCREYGADVCYSEMLDAEKLVADEAYRQQVFTSQIHPADRPLIVQFGGNNPAAFAAAAALVAPHCDGVDINLGCPQVTRLLVRCVEVLGQWMLMGLMGLLAG